MSQPVALRNFVRGIVEQKRKSHSPFAREALSVIEVVLGYPPELDSGCARLQELLVKSLKKRKGILASRTGYFKKGGQQRPPGKCVSSGIGLSVHPDQIECRRLPSG